MSQRHEQNPPTIGDANAHRRPPRRRPSIASLSTVITPPPSISRHLPLRRFPSASRSESALEAAARRPPDGGAHERGTRPALLGRLRWRDADARLESLAGREGGGLLRHCQGGCGLAAAGRECGGRAAVLAVGA